MSIAYAAGSRFIGVANTGAPMLLADFDHPAIYNLAGMHIARGGVPLMFGHNEALRLGWTDAVWVRGAELLIAGPFVNNPASRQVIRDAWRHAWQLSARGGVYRQHIVSEGRSEAVNGVRVHGPAIVIDLWQLKEISVVEAGADGGTWLRLSPTPDRLAEFAALTGQKHEPLSDTWLASGYDRQVRGHFDIATLHRQLKMMAAGWNEDEHPRDERGRFGEGGGGGGEKADKGEKPKDAGSRPERPSTGFTSESHLDTHAAAMVKSHEADPHVAKLVENRDKAAAEAQTLRDKAKELTEAAREAISRDDFKTMGEHYAALKDVHAKEKEASATVEKEQAGIEHESRRSFMLSFGIKGDNATFTATDTGKANAKVRQENFQKASDFLREVSTAEAIGKQHVIIDSSYTKGGDGRAGHSNGVIFSGKNDDAPTMAHELGHQIEDHPGVRDKVTAFSEKRFGDEKPKDMRQVAPSGNYRRGEEFGRKDELEKVFGSDKAGIEKTYYTGKTYPGGKTEVLSMGIEQLYRDPVHFAKADPEYFRLVVGILQGSKK